MASKEFRKWHPENKDQSNVIGREDNKCFKEQFFGFACSPPQNSQRPTSPPPLKNTKLTTILTVLHLSASESNKALTLLTL
jgi:hypothetical protein